MLTAQFIPYQNLKQAHYQHVAQYYIKLAEVAEKKGIQVHDYVDEMRSGAYCALAIEFTNGRHAIVEQRAEYWRTLDIKLESVDRMQELPVKVLLEELVALADLLGLPVEKFFPAGVVLSE